MAAHLALGTHWPTAAERAQQYVAGAIRHALAIGRGHGPLDHFWQTRIQASAGLITSGDEPINARLTGCQMTGQLVY